MVSQRQQILKKKLREKLSPDQGSVTDEKSQIMSNKRNLVSPKSYRKGSKRRVKNMEIVHVANKTGGAAFKLCAEEASPRTGGPASLKREVAAFKGKM